MVAEDREELVVFVQNLMHCYTLSYTYINNNISIIKVTHDVGHIINNLRFAGFS